MRNASAGENHPTREKATRGVSPFLAWGDFHARSRFAPSTNPEEKWGTTRSLVIPAILSETNIALFTGWKFIQCVDIYKFQTTDPCMIRAFKSNKCKQTNKPNY